VVCDLGNIELGSSSLSHGRCWLGMMLFVGGCGACRNIEWIFGGDWIGIELW
jgi:hypothetical protein